MEPAVVVDSHNMKRIFSEVLCLIPVLEIELIS